MTTTGLPDLVLERIRESRLPGVDLTNVPFSSVFSDHMFTAEYRDGAWREAALRPYGPLPLPPSITALQYGVSVFEGLKAHRTPAGAPPYRKHRAGQASSISGMMRAPRRAVRRDAEYGGIVGRDGGAIHEGAGGQ